MQTINTSRFIHEYIEQLVHIINDTYSMYTEVNKHKVQQYAAAPEFHPSTIELTRNITIIRHKPYKEDTDLTKLFDLSPFLDKIHHAPRSMHVAQLVLNLGRDFYYPGLRFHIMLLLYRDDTVQLIDTQYPDLLDEIPAHSQIEQGIYNQVSDRKLHYINGDALYGKYRLITSIEESRTRDYNTFGIKYELANTPVQEYENLNIIQVYKDHKDAQSEAWGGDCEYLNIVILDYIIRNIPITNLTESPSAFINTLHAYMKATYTRLSMPR